MMKLCSYRFFLEKHLNINTFNNAIFYTKNIHYNRYYNHSRNNSTLANLTYSIANSSPVRYTMDSLISLHEWSHMPWVMEITLVTFLTRSLITFPLTLLQRKILSRYQKIKPELEHISKHLKKRVIDEAIYMGLGKTAAQKIFMRKMIIEINRLIIRDNCHPIKAMMVPFFQIPFWIILSNSYRNFVLLFPDSNDPKLIKTFEQLQHEGIFWFKDLTVPDPTAILPILTCIINLTIIQIRYNERRKHNMKDGILIRILTTGSCLISLALLPIGLTMPADMTFYWFISSSVGLLQNILLQNPKAMKLFKLS